MNVVAIALIPVLVPLVLFLLSRAANSSAKKGTLAYSKALQRVGVPAALGIVYAPATWFAVAVDLKLHFNYIAPVDYVAPALALRFRIVRTLNLELDAAVPVAGADRHTALAMLSLGYRF